MLVSVALFSLMDAGLKTLSAHYPPLQVAALRGASSLPLVLAWALWTAGPMALLTSNETSIDGSRLALGRFFGLLDKPTGVFPIVTR